MVEKTDTSMPSCIDPLSKVEGASWHEVVAGERPFDCEI